MSGQSHLIDPSENTLEIGGVPHSLKTLCMDAHTGGEFLAQQIQADVRRHGRVSRVIHLHEMPDPGPNAIVLVLT